ncbi:putative glucosyl/glucuronosyl transferase [Paraphoma chrysanthemicola]|uniref:Glucosyl/glucuronosyl transferase n=1 Tax=Paraphoma chrysanthemicola TaxID=798071 RepID=A0A8K0R3I7_9PLEO|nr:putative glucosyl/glucuronosyl transferase [Paraphoma chrysanthemicola]
MATNPPTEKSRPELDAPAQQSIIQQAQAAAAAQTDSTAPTRQNSYFQEINLVNSNVPDDDVPPPPYGDIYGEIRDEKGSSGTSAYVTDDGRVNIRINQLNRRLSQIFTPALQQHVQAGQESNAPPTPYIPPSLGGDESVPPPPPLNVVIQVVGSRGDVQPFVALGRVLKATYGHRVRLATHPNFKSFVEENDLEFFSIGGDPSQLMAFMVKNPSLMPGFRSLVSGDVSRRRRDVAEYIQGCWRSCYKSGDGNTEDDSSELAARPFVADCIIANPPSFAHIHCAEKLGIPLHMMFTMPYSPTQAFPHPLANIQSNADPQLTNYISYAMIEVLSWQGLGDIINRFRAKCLGLDPVSTLSAPGMLQRLKVPHTYCWSPALIPKPIDWGSHISISGFYFLDSPDYTPDPELQAFLDAGPPPVYIGFGSIVLKDPNAMTDLILEAVKKTGQRLLLSKGWGGIGAEEIGIPDNVFMLGNVPHDWLFKQVSCVVHHGGAGTTAAGISAGRPTVVVPFFGDQPFWGSMVARAGAGPDPIPHKHLTADNLASAIDFCLKPESLERAKELASKIAAERGCEAGAQSFHQFLEVDRLRCTLAPSRAAAWRVKRTQVRLSAFAACTLANAKVLDFQDLKLFRPQEYSTDEGPTDPISGPFTVACRVFTNVARGLTDVPSETWKAAQLPFAPSRHQSQASLAKVTSNGESSSMGGRSTSPTSAASSPTNSSKDPDMMRRTAPHSSKGIGHLTKTLIQSPMELSVSMTKGFHNVPKLWGDDTVRPQERVTDLKSGMKAAGREFGYGWYDGVTGLVTQPWQGARKDGAGGFFKGVGKGMAGLVTKSGAGCFSIIGYSMKGVHKEVQKQFGNNPHTYIITSRTAQGYEEWLQSSEEEKKDVIVRWKLIQKYLKKKTGTDEMVNDILEAQRKRNTTGSFASNGDASGRTSDSSNFVAGSPRHSAASANTEIEQSLGPAEINETIRQVVQETSRGDTENDADVERAIQENVSQFQRQRQEVVDHEAHQESLRQAIATSQAESQRHARAALEYEEQLKQVIAQSLREQRHESSDDARNSDTGPVDGTDAEAGDSTARSEVAAGKAPTVSHESHDTNQPPSYDPGHLAGTIQSEHEAQQQGEKSEQEKTEEQIVLEYVKKQSLLEEQHRAKGKARAPPAKEEDEDEHEDAEDLQKALNLSLQDSRKEKEER